MPPVGLSESQNIIRLVCSTLELCTSRWLQLSLYCKLNQNLVASLLEEYDESIDNYLVTNYFSMVCMHVGCSCCESKRSLVTKLCMQVQASGNLLSRTNLIEG